MAEEPPALPDRTDIVQNTQARRGAKMSFYRRGVLNTKDSKGTIIDQIPEGVEAVGDQHGMTVGKMPSTFPGDPWLPLRTVDIVRWGEGQAWRIGGYARRGSSSGQTPVAEAMKIQTGMEAVSWYRLPFNTAEENTPVFTDGYPAGDFHDSDALRQKEKAKPSPYSWSFPVMDIFVSATLDYNPIGTVFGRTGKVNSDEMTWDLIRFAPGTLRFNGAVVEWAESSGGVATYSTQYHFTASAIGWKLQSAFFNKEEEPGAWSTATGLRYEQTPFVGSFPTGFSPESEEE